MEEEKKSWHTNCVYIRRRLRLEKGSHCGLEVLEDSSLRLQVLPFWLFFVVSDRQSRSVPFRFVVCQWTDFSAQKCRTAHHRRTLFYRKWTDLCLWSVALRRGCEAAEIKDSRQTRSKSQWNLQVSNCRIEIDCVSCESCEIVYDCYRQYLWSTPLSPGVVSFNEECRWTIAASYLQLQCCKASTISPSWAQHARSNRWLNEQIYWLNNH